MLISLNIIKIINNIIKRQKKRTIPRFQRGRPPSRSLFYSSNFGSTGVLDLTYVATSSLFPRLHSAVNHRYFSQNDKRNKVMSVSLSTDNYKNLNDALDRLLEAGEKRQMQPDDVQRGILLLWTKVQSEARNPYGLLVKGRLEMYQGGLEEALVTLRQAIAIDANLHPAMTIAGLLLMKAGKKEKALAMMKQAEQAAVEQGADEETLTKCLLDVALTQQHIPALREAAEATIRSAVAIHPSVLEGHLRLAGLLSNQGRNEEEIELSVFLWLWLVPLFKLPTTTKEQQRMAWLSLPSMTIFCWGLVSSWVSNRNGMLP